MKHIFLSGTLLMAALVLLFAPNTTVTKAADTDKFTQGLRIIKIAIGDNGKTTFEFVVKADYLIDPKDTYGTKEQPITVDSQYGWDDVNVPLKPGVYSVSEKPVKGWKPNPIVSCVNLRGERLKSTGVVINEGQIATCVFVDVKSDISSPPELSQGLRIIKIAIGDNGKTTFEFVIKGKNTKPKTVSVDVGPRHGGEGVDVPLDPGTYSISENPIDGWYPPTIKCTQSGVFFPGPRFVIEEGKPIICLVTNIKKFVKTSTNAGAISPETEFVDFFGANNSEDLIAADGSLYVDPDDFDPEAPSPLPTPTATTSSTALDLTNLLQASIASLAGGSFAIRQILKMFRG